MVEGIMPIKVGDQIAKKGYKMARRNDAVDVDFDESEVEDVAVADETETVEKVAKPKKEPVRGDLPEGYVTPIGLAKVLTERGLHQNREGETVEVRPQMVYSYIKNASKEDPFPMETVTDSLGHDRQAFPLENGVAWWERKNERAAARKVSAAAKKEAKAARAEAKAAEEAEGAEEATEAVEAE